MKPPGTLFERRYALAWAALLASLLLTGLVWHGLRTQIRHNFEQHFDLRAREVVGAIESRMRDHEQILLGGAGLFDAADGRVDRAAWRAYVERLNLARNYPGIQGVGYSRLIAPRELAAHVAAVRAEGFPAYTVRPPGEREQYTAIIYLEPFTDRNLAAFGYDMLSEPTRERVMRRAGESGETAISGKVKLVQEIRGKVQAGLLMYVPVYDRKKDLSTPQARWAALRGFVYSPYRVSNLMRGILGERQAELDFALYDGEQETAEALMYDSAQEREDAPAAAAPVLSSTRLLFVHGQKWFVRLDSRPELEAELRSPLPLTVLALGAGASLLLFLLLVFLISRRDQAEAIARAMTAEIRRNQARLIEAEHAARENARYLQAILDNAVDGIITIDEQGTVQSFNRAAETIFGYQAAEVLGRNVNMLMPEPYHSQHDGYLRNYRDTGVARIIGVGREVEGRRRDGSTFPLDLAVSRSEHLGSPTYIGLVRDITERKRVEKMKSEFVSTVSHELRTPLTAIRGALGLVGGGALGAVSEPVGAMLKIASNNTERLLLLINDILDIQKIESGQMVFRFKSLEVSPFLRQLLLDLAAYGEQYDVRFELVREVAGAHVYADRERLAQVMANLLSNAAKFSPAGQRVEVAVSGLEKHWRISVTDVGPGIPEAFQPRLFERFTQADSTDARGKGGTGLGLAITKAIVEKHGGRIGFVTRPGAGTTFHVDLPLIAGGAAAEETRAPGGDAQPARVLVVEDDPDVAALIQRMLTDAGCVADVAHDAAQARALLARHGQAYQLMTLDIVLPGEDGLSLLHSLRASEATRRLPVVVLSLKADEARHELNGGAVNVLDWLSKPIDQARLVEVVRRAAASDRQPRVLHVEDDPDILRVIDAMLVEQCELTAATTLAAARAALLRQEFDLVLLDVGLPDGSGLELLDTIEHRVRPPRVVIFSAQDVSPADAGRVQAALVKSRTSNEELVRFLRETMRRA